MGARAFKEEQKALPVQTLPLLNLAKAQLFKTSKALQAYRVRYASKKPKPAKRIYKGRVAICCKE